MLKKKIEKWKTGSSGFICCIAFQLGFCCCSDWHNWAPLAVARIVQHPTCLLPSSPSCSGVSGGPGSRSGLCCSWPWVCWQAARGCLGTLPARYGRRRLGEDLYNVIQGVYGRGEQPAGCPSMVPALLCLQHALPLSFFSLFSYLFLWKPSPFLYSRQLSTQQPLLSGLLFSLLSNLPDLLLGKCQLGGCV